MCQSFPTLVPFSVWWQLCSQCDGCYRPSVLMPPSTAWANFCLRCLLWKVYIWSSQQCCRLSVYRILGVLRSAGCASRNLKRMDISWYSVLWTHRLQLVAVSHVYKKKCVPRRASPDLRMQRATILLSARSSCFRGWHAFCTVHRHFLLLFS